LKSFSFVNKYNTQITFPYDLLFRDVHMTGHSRSDCKRSSRRKLT